MTVNRTNAASYKANNGRDFVGPGYTPLNWGNLQDLEDSIYCEQPFRTTTQWNYGEPSLPLIPQTQPNHKNTRHRAEPQITSTAIKRPKRKQQKQEISSFTKSLINTILKLDRLGKAIASQLKVPGPRSEVITGRITDASNTLKRVESSQMFSESDIEKIELGGKEFSNASKMHRLVEIISAAGFTIGVLSMPAALISEKPLIPGALTGLLLSTTPFATLLEEDRRQACNKESERYLKLASQLSQQNRPNYLR